MKEKKQPNIKGRIVKISTVFGSLVVLVLALMYVLPMFFADTVTRTVRDLAKQKIKGEIKFEKMDLSFYKKFPSLTVTVEQLVVQGIPSEKSGALLDAKSLSIGVNLWSLFQDQIQLTTLYLDDPNIRISIDQNGQANYAIFKSEDENTEESDSTDLRIERIKISNANLSYTDLLTPIEITATGFDYLGTGDLSAEVFELKTRAKIDAFSLVFDQVAYVKDKPVLANLITKIDTKSLNFVFEKNDLKIKGLPVNFKGKFSFIDRGYDLDFDVQSKGGQLDQLLSLLPPEYQSWLDETQISGDSDLQFYLKGQFIAEDNTKPEVYLGLNISNARIAHQNMATAVSDLALEFELKIPQLDLQQTDIHIKNLAFEVAGDRTQMSLHTQGIKDFSVEGFIKSRLNLKSLDQAIGLSAYDLEGILDIDFQTLGAFAHAEVVSGLRKDQIDTVLSSIPTFHLQAELKEGYFKKSNLAESLRDVNFKVIARGLDSDYKNISLEISDISARALNNFISGNFKLANLRNYDMDVDLKGALKLEELTSFMPFDRAELKGDLTVNAIAKGSYEPAKKKYPIIDADLKLLSGLIITKDFPELPITDIDIETHISTKRGSMRDLLIKVLPIRFKIADEPFQLDASLYNLENLNYNINSKGSLNLAKIYKLFKIKGLNVDGLIRTNLSLKGLQSDALAGNFNKLQNKGMLEVDHMIFKSELFPQSLKVHKGVFKFYKERMKFEDFRAQYGSSRFSVNGYLTNVIQFALDDRAVLGGLFTVKSKMLNVDELTVFAPTAAASSNANATAAAGVVMVPKNFNLQFDAQIGQLLYGDLVLNNFGGSLQANRGALQLKEAKFDLVGTQVAMKGSYLPLNYKKASFEYEIEARNFDIQRAYKEIKLFREMAAMAKDAYGRVSLNYQLSGTLNEEMFPVLNTVVGSGSLTLEDIQFKGFKLLNAIADKTEASSLENASVSQVEIKTTIKNNVMTVERTKMKMAGFRPRFEGQITLDGKMNIGFRLGLPPLGLIGIPMKINGTPDNFSIKLGRYKEADMGDEPDGADLESVNDPIPEPEVLPLPLEAVEPQ